MIEDNNPKVMKEYSKYKEKHIRKLNISRF